MGSPDQFWQRDSALSALKRPLTTRRRAERIILDQRSFFLEPKLHERFLAMLDRPAKQSKELHALMKRKPSWQRGPWNSDVAAPAPLADLA